MTGTDSPPLHVVVLAAGEGKRMRSAQPKVMMPVGGRPMLGHVLETVRTLSPAGVHLVYGHGGDSVREPFEQVKANWVVQREQLGTGHAVQQAMPDIPDHGQVLVLYGDTPLVPGEDLADLAAGADNALSILTMRPGDPSGYGRVIRDDRGEVTEIVEERDATSAQKRIQEVNSGILAAPAGKLRDWLSRVTNDNAQGEYYLTDVIGLARADGVSIHAAVAPDASLLLGANDRWQLSRLERRFQRLQAERLCRDGATVMDPDRLDVRGSLRVGTDVMLDVNNLFEGDVVLGDGVRIGPNCLLRDVRVANGTEILANSVLEDCEIGRGCRIGPFARIRPGTRMDDGAAVGNFVEVKKSRIGEGSKVNHLSYVGDADLGSDVNIGAGTITCNYDGANKHRTVIGDNAFIGSNTAIVAPVTIGAGATIGAGSTVSRDAPSGKLTVSRAKQVTIDGWKRPEKK